MSVGKVTQKDRSNKMKDLYQNELCVTYILRVNGEEFPCNAAVLHAALPSIPAEEWEDTFRKVRPSLIAPLLRYMYCMEMTFSMDTLKDLMIASKLLKLSHLQDSCEDLLKQELCPENYLGWYKFATKEKFDATASYCKERIYRELNKVRQCPQFHELSLADVSDVINDKRNGGDDDDDDDNGSGKRCDWQFHAAMSWLLVEESRSEHAETLLDLIELSNCSKQCLKLATEEPYSAVLWSITLQNKLLRACLQSVQSDEIVDERYVPKEFTVPQEHIIDQQMQPSADFGVEMLSRFQQFYNNKLHTDITLQLFSGDVVDAHQVVLAVQSPYFEALVRRSADKKHDGDSMTGMPASVTASAHVSAPDSAPVPAPTYAPESAPDSGQASAPDAGQASTPASVSTCITTDLSHLDLNAVNTAVGFMYTGSADIQNSPLLRLIETCDFLQLKYLLEECKQLTKRGFEISDENCYDCIKAGRLFSLPDIQTRAVVYVCKNFERVRLNENLKSLERDDVLMILNSQLPLSIDEQSVYEAIIVWITHCPDSRCSCLSTLLTTDAVKNCSVNTSIDMEALLEAFGVDEKVQVWKVHYSKLQEVRDRDRQNAIAVEQKANAAEQKAKSAEQKAKAAEQKATVLGNRIDRHCRTCPNYFI